MNNKIKTLMKIFALYEGNVYFVFRSVDGKDMMQVISAQSFCIELSNG